MFCLQFFTSNSSTGNSFKWVAMLVCSRRVYEYFKYQQDFQSASFQYLCHTRVRMEIPEPSYPIQKMGEVLLSKKVRIHNVVSLTRATEKYLGVQKCRKLASVLKQESNIHIQPRVVSIVLNL